MAAATIKMDELLVSWIGRDDIYESIMEWIDNYSAAAAATAQQQQLDDDDENVDETGILTIEGVAVAGTSSSSVSSLLPTTKAITTSSGTALTMIDKPFKKLSLNDDKENNTIVTTMTGTTVVDNESETTSSDAAAAATKNENSTSTATTSTDIIIPSFYPIGQQYPRRRLTRSLSSSSSLSTTSTNSSTTGTGTGTGTGTAAGQPGSSVANPIVATTTSYSSRMNRKSRSAANAASTATTIPVTTNILSQYDTWEPLVSVSLNAPNDTTSTGKIKKKSSNLTKLNSRINTKSGTSADDDDDIDDNEFDDVDNAFTDGNGGFQQQLSQSTTLNGSTDMSDDDDDDTATILDHNSNNNDIKQSPSSLLVTPYPCARDCAQAIYNEISTSTGAIGTAGTDAAVVETQRLQLDQFVRITKDVCRFPSYFNHALYIRIIELWNTNLKETEKDIVDSTTGTKTIVIITEDDGITIDMVEWYFVNEMEPYDAYDRFFRLVRQPTNNNFIVRDDFLLFIKALLSDHPGLEFLSSHAEFQEKYAVTVITRIFYSVNRCHSGRITARQVRRSDLLEAFTQVDEEEDINKVTRYFSYEHFYVLYCRFWELDHDRDYRITREDLLKYGDHSLSHMIVDRIFDAAPRPFHTEQQQRNTTTTTATEASTAATTGTTTATTGNELATTTTGTNTPPGTNSRDYLSYEDFIYFMLSEEDKSNEVAVRYWFACVDVDGDNKLNNMEMRSFYAVQLHRMQCTGHEIVPFDDMLCQMMDMIKPANTEYLVVEDFLQVECCLVSGALFDALFNLNKYLLFEQRDPFVERQKREDEFDCDWDRFACIDYNRLAMEEEAREEESMDIDWVTVDDEDEEQTNNNAAATAAGSGQQQDIASASASEAYTTSSKSEPVY